MVWAFATLNVSHPVLFQIVDGDNLSKLREFESFRSQNLANIVWAYATLDIEHPVLFKRVGDHVASDSLKSYIPQDFSNIVRAFATAGVQHAELFETVGDHINKLDD
jgi:hypothetical protein